MDSEGGHERGASGKEGKPLGQHLGGPHLAGAAKVGDLLANTRPRGRVTHAQQSVPAPQRCQLPGGGLATGPGCAPDGNVPVAVPPLNFLEPGVNAEVAREVRPVKPKPAFDSPLPLSPEPARRRH